MPPHCIILNLYAWKPAVLHNAIQQYRSILWIDARSNLRSPLEPISSTLRKDGHFFVQGQDLDMTQMSMEDTYTALNTTRNDFAGQPHFSGGLQGYTRGSVAHEKILNPFYAYSLDEACIAPPHSNLGNHRYDQTLLSILIYQCGMKISPKTKWLAAARNQLHEDPMQPSNAIIYTARATSIDYAPHVRNTNDQFCYANRRQKKIASQ